MLAGRTKVGMGWAPCPPHAGLDPCRPPCASCPSLRPGRGAAQDGGAGPVTGAAHPRPARPRGCQLWQGDTGTPGVSRHGVTGIPRVPSCLRATTPSRPPLSPWGHNLSLVGPGAPPSLPMPCPRLHQGTGGDGDGMGQARGTGPRPFLCPPCSGMARHPLAPTSTRSSSHRRAVGGTGRGDRVTGEGDSILSEEDGTPHGTSASALGRDSPRCRARPGTPEWGRCWGLPRAPALAGGAGLEQGPHPHSRATLDGHRRGLGGGAQWGATGVLRQASPTRGRTCCGRVLSC